MDGLASGTEGVIDLPTASGVDGIANVRNSFKDSTDPDPDDAEPQNVIPALNQDEVLDIALNLARTGYPVLPLSGDKKPTVARGFYAASTDPDEIRRMWRARPGPLIGVRTGETSGIDALDIDLKHDAARAFWHANYRRLPDTRAYKSRSGGLHLWFRHCPDLGCSIGRLAEGVDVRGDGGYVTAWHAVGFPVLDHSPPAAWPSWLLRELNRPRREAWTATTAVADDKTVGGLIKAVSTATEGSRNAMLYWAACRMAERKASLPTTEATLMPAARAAGLDGASSLATIRSAYRGSR